MNKSNSNKIIDIDRISAPIRARIEVSRVCNLKCHACPMGSNKVKNKKLMSYNDFKKIIKLVNRSVKEISLFNFGEPLLNPHIIKMIKFAKDNGIKIINLHSNGLLLNKELSQGLIESGLDNISVSIDGVSNETYTKYRVGGDLNKLLKNIREFVGIKKDMGVKKPIIEAQLVIMKHNENEIDKFSEICKDIGVDRVVYKTFNADMSGYEDRNTNSKFIPTNIKYSRYKTTKAKEIDNCYKLDHCMWPWENLVVNANGDIALCCNDYNADYKLGNILKDDNWWDIENRRKLQNDMIRDKSKIKICKHCSMPGNIKEL